VYDSGNRNALVPISNVKRLEAARPNWSALSSLFDALKLTDIHLYCLLRNKSSAKRLRAQCRNFFPYGVFEEPATGTASVALASMLIDSLSAAGTDVPVKFVLEQGHGRRRGIIHVERHREADGELSLWLKGRVFAVVEGRLISTP